MTAPINNDDSFMQFFDQELYDSAMADTAAAAAAAAAEAPDTAVGHDFGVFDPDEEGMDFTTPQISPSLSSLFGDEPTPKKETKTAVFHEKIPLPTLPTAESDHVKLVLPERPAKKTADVPAVVVSETENLPNDCVDINPALLCPQKAYKIRMDSGMSLKDSCESGCVCLQEECIFNPQNMFLASHSVLAKYDFSDLSGLDDLELDLDCGCDGRQKDCWCQGDFPFEGTEEESDAYSSAAPTKKTGMTAAEARQAEAIEASRRQQAILRAQGAHIPPTQASGVPAGASPEALMQPTEPWMRPTPAKEYIKLSSPPRAWGTPTAKGLFRYTAKGQWQAGLKFSEDELRSYVQDFVSKTRSTPRELKIWMQHTPGDMDVKVRKTRHQQCRWDECPVPDFEISEGFLRVAFDEFPLQRGDSLDPFTTTGYMHLHCFEKVFDLAHLLALGLIAADLRVFPHEKSNPYALDRPGAHMAAVFSKWTQNMLHQLAANGQQRLIGREDSLWYHLTRAYLAQLTPVQRRWLDEGANSLVSCEGDLDELENQRNTAAEPAAVVPAAVRDLRAVKRPCSDSEVDAQMMQDFEEALRLEALGGSDSSSGKGRKHQMDSVGSAAMQVPKRFRGASEDADHEGDGSN